MPLWFSLRTDLPTHVWLFMEHIAPRLSWRAMVVWHPSVFAVFAHQICISGGRHTHLLLRTRLGVLGLTHKVFGLPASLCAGSQSAALAGYFTQIEFCHTEMPCSIAKGGDF